VGSVACSPGPSCCCSGWTGDNADCVVFGIGGWRGWHRGANWTEPAGQAHVVGRLEEVCLLPKRRRWRFRRNANAARDDGAIARSGFSCELREALILQRFCKSAGWGAKGLTESDAGTVDRVRRMHARYVDGVQRSGAAATKIDPRLRTPAVVALLQNVCSQDVSHSRSAAIRAARSAVAHVHFAKMTHRHQLTLGPPACATGREPSPERRQLSARSCQLSMELRSRWLRNPRARI
jgi:hypothetical protein